MKLFFPRVITAAGEPGESTAIYAGFAPRNHRTPRTSLLFFKIVEAAPAETLPLNAFSPVVAAR
jgi:hypothetical protein